MASSEQVIKPPRATLVIGVGGTGSWVLSWLKKDLLETYGTLDKVPVRMVLLDVAGNIAVVGAAGQDDLQNQQPGSYSNIIIDDDEFIRLPVGSYQQTLRLAEQAKAKDSQVEHLSRWFAAEDFLKNPNVLNLTAGASQFRQLGRLALAQGFNTAATGNANRVYTQLDSLIRKIPRRDSTLDIHIAGSFAGGCGSGLFMDVAALVRRLGADQQLNVYGYFALPTVFSRNPGDDMSARSFAAWRELNRLMTVNSDTAFNFQWSDSVGFKLERPLYDQVYIVDSGFDGGTLANDPTESIFPIMAEAISFFIDGTSGEQYIQNITTNLNRRKMSTEYNNKPVYSTLYVKSWKLPTYHHLNVARHELAKTYLQRLLAVEAVQERDPATDLVRKVYRLKKLNNGFTDAIEILNGNMPDGIPAVAMLAKVQQILNIRDIEKDSAINVEANGDPLVYFSQLPQDEAATIAKLNTLGRLSVPNVEVGGDFTKLEGTLYSAHEYLYGRAAAAQGRYFEYYGDFNGSEKGNLYRELGVVKRHTMEVFKERVQYWITQTLKIDENAENPGSELARVKTALESMIVMLNDVRGFYNDVIKTMDPPLKVNAQANAGFQNAVQTVKHAGLLERIITPLNAGKVRKAVARWNSAETRYNAVQRRQRIIERITETLDAMIDFVENEALRKLNAIIEQLVTGSEYDQIQGLYQGILNSLDAEYERHAFDKKLKDVTKLIDMTEDESLIRVDPAEVERLIRRTKWSVDDQMNITMSVQVSDNQEPIVLDANLRDPRQTRKLVSRLIHDVADKVLANEDRPSALSRIDPSILRTEMAQCNNTLFNPSNRQRDAVHTFYLRAYHTDREAEKLDEMVESLNLSKNAGNTYEVVNSANRDKIVAFSAREIMLTDAFTVWEKAKEKYQSFLRKGEFDDLRLQQVFAAEQNALTLENHYYQEKRTSLPILHPRLVHLLSERNLLVEFLEMWSFGWISLTEEITPSGVRAHIWTLQVPDDAAYYLCEDTNKTMLDVIAAYLFREYDIKNRNLRREAITRKVNFAITEQTGTPEERQRLNDKLVFERMMAERFTVIIEDAMRDAGTDQLIDAPSTRVRLEKASERYNGEHVSLAEAIAHDLIAEKSQGGRLVTDIEPHYQVIDVLLSLLYSEIQRRIMR